ncbi:lipocalin-like domain-containing protein [Shewanella sp. VB17]|uniref:lipocalin-like domain-containing protein n=1 Tax=Shewanella sp. VB17 TaxID=2739432 RepID=UPI0020B7EA33|nr:lipocalin-like domain-containing protein [Shewanella sp. VB17]
MSSSPHANNTYTQVDKNKVIVFPQDHLAHDDFRQEWWYLTANLETEHGKKIGLQWTQFRIAMTPVAPHSTLLKNQLATSSNKPISIKNNEPSWISNQLYMAHAAVTSASQHFATEKWSRQHPQLANVSNHPFTVKIDDWRWISDGNTLFPATLEVTGEQFNYRLTLHSSAPYQRQGNQGYSVKTADGSVASHYYSQPYIQVSGNITLQGEEHNVTGQAWLDREWSSQFLNKTQAGWDWFALRLHDGSTLMLFQLRDQAKSPANQSTANFYSARRMFADGSGHNIASTNITLTALDWHTIDLTRYPTSWQISIPSEHIDIKINALNPNAKMSLTISYWEGPVLISGSHQGEGYLELTGY